MTTEDCVLSVGLCLLLLQSLQRTRAHANEHVQTNARAHTHTTTNTNTNTNTNSNEKCVKSRWMPCLMDREGGGIQVRPRCSLLQTMQEPAMSTSLAFFAKLARRSRADPKPLRNSSGSRCGLPTESCGQNPSSGPQTLNLGQVRNPQLGHESRQSRRGDVQVRTNPGFPGSRSEMSLQSVFGSLAGGPRETLAPGTCQKARD